MEGNPLVSVIITTCNGDYKLVRAVDSVLMQTYNNIEIIVVDDNGNGTASRIETEKMMEKFSNTERVIYLKHEQNKNGSAARNTGIRTAKGKYVAFLDDDDVFNPLIIPLSLIADNHICCYCLEMNNFIIRRVKHG